MLIVDNMITPSIYPADACVEWLLELAPREERLAGLVVVAAS
jgi:hypothetical protein